MECKVNIFSENKSIILQTQKKTTDIRFLKYLGDILGHKTGHIFEILLINIESAVRTANLVKIALFSFLSLAPFVVLKELNIMINSSKIANF